MLKLDFVDFWPGFDKKDNYFYNLLKEDYDIVISNDPDFLFFSIFGKSHLSYKCKKIFYTGENIPPQLDYCDYSFSFDYLDDKRNYRLPHYLLYDGYYDLVNKKVDENLLDRKFCNFVASNPNSPVRNEFVKKLSQYKKVDCGGRWMNNIGHPVSDKRKFQSGYKFSISFENGAYRGEFPGYTTEKIIEPMTVNSIPIYHGNPLINKEFNTKSFINFYDFNDFDKMIEFIIELDNNDDKYLEMLKKPWFDNNEIPEVNKKENILSFLKKIIDEK